METRRKRRGKGPTEHTVSKGHNGVKKSTRRSSLQLSKATGQSENLLVEKVENSSETTKRLPFLELCPGQTLDPSTKVKLQLFPIDEGTRIGLEKDGYHPYLELTLSARKKISSVLKHLTSKWGSSSIALGEPMLFPYDTLENSASYRWTLNDSVVSAGDIYAAVGSPAIFRLRYGWFPGSETKTTGVPFTSTPAGVCLQSERVQRGCSANTENTFGKRKQIEVTREEFVKPVIVSEATHVVVTEKMSSNEPVDPTDNEVAMDTGIGQSSALWADSLTNISIGGLLSEASLQGRFNHRDPKSNGSNGGLQPSQLISDSFDAFLAGQINHSQGPRLPPHDSRSSILDAEDTCHAFSFQKFSSSDKDALSLGGSAYSQIFSQDAGSKSFKFPNSTEANNIQSGLPQGHCQESETELQLCSRVYNDESSLGLSGIKWTDSLGPFDLGLSSSQKIISGTISASAAL